MLRSIAVPVLVNALMLAAAPSAVFAQGLNSPSRALEGVWAMSITLRDCATQAPLGPPFRSLLTFHAGGTVSESAGTPQFAPGQRSPGHGNWWHLGGAAFRMRMAAMILFETPPAPPNPGFKAGWQVITSTMTFTSLHGLTLAATAQMFDINRQPYRVACPTGSAERFR